ncbi:MAG TPA: hypothetical protein QF572_21185 [Vicinamibacterales bacterium]|jgi:hypothetical protein|nr:hypothetical protein [Vicinamibacterales bacterium]
MRSESASLTVLVLRVVVRLLLALTVLAVWQILLLRLYIDQPIVVVGWLAAVLGLVVAGRAVANRLHSARRSRLDRVWARLDATGIGFVACLLLLLFLFHWGFERAASDGREYFVQVRSLVLDGDLDFANENDTFGVRGTASSYAFGAPLLWAPFFVLCHLWLGLLNLFGTDFVRDGFGNSYQRAVGIGTVVYGFAGLVLMAQLLQDYFSRRLSFLVTIVLCFGTFLVWYLAVENSMVHGVSMFVTTLFLFVWHRGRAQPSLTRWAMVGAAGGLMAMVRWQNGLFVVLPVSQMAIETWRQVDGDRRAKLRQVFRRASVCATTLALAFLPQLVFWKVVRGAWISLPTSEHGVTWTTTHIGDVLFSSNHGLVSSTPIVYLALLGLPLFIRRDAVLAAVLIVGFLGQLYVNSTVDVWWGGSGFGGRRFANCALVFAVGLASLLEWLRRRPLVAPAAVLVSFLALNTVFALDLRRGRWPAQEGVTFDDIVGALYDRLGNPFSFPLNAGIAWSYDVGLPVYDRLKGRTYNNFEIDVGASGDERFLGDGWFLREQAPEFSFRWSAGDESVVVVPLKESDDYRLEIQCAPFAYPGASPQTIELTVNGTVLDTITVEPGLNIYAREIPARHIRPNLNQFRFRYGYATSPDSVGLSADSRRLGVQVAMVRLTRLLRNVPPE